MGEVTQHPTVPVPALRRVTRAGRSLKRGVTDAGGLGPEVVMGRPEGGLGYGPGQQYRCRPREGQGQDG